MGKLNGANGNAIWAKLSGSTGTYHTDLAADSTGAVVLGGRFSSTTNFGGANLTADGTYDGHVVKFDGAGNFVWQAAISGSGGGDDEVYAITVAPDDKVTALAYVRSATVLAAGVSMGPGATDSSDVVVAQYTKNGGGVWAKRFGGNGNQSAYAVSAFPNGDVVTGGVFDTTFSIGTYSVAFSSTMGGYDSFFAVLAGDSGTPRWAARAGSADMDYARAVVASNNVFYGFGQYTQQGTFFGKTLEAVSSTDVYGVAIARP